ncbi:TPA: BspA family leucine-rich repeat surface protein [Enterococcus faecalis]|nr:BspA family leucine-rich repeat surface protein [Enterococcus faecalis]
MMNLKKFKYITLTSVLLGNVFVSSGVVIAENSEKTMTDEQSQKALEIINKNKTDLSTLEGKINENTDNLEKVTGSDESSTSSTEEAMDTEIDNGVSASTDTATSSSKEESTVETNNDNLAVTEESTNDSQIKEENNNTSVQKSADIQGKDTLAYGWAYNIVKDTPYRYLMSYSGDPEHIKIPSRIGGYNVVVDLSDGLARYGIDKTKVKSITFVDNGSQGNIKGVSKQLGDNIVLATINGGPGAGVSPINGNKIDFSGFTNLESVDFSGFTFDDDSYGFTKQYWDFREMFAGDVSLKSINFKSNIRRPGAWKQILRFRNAFKDCISLESVEFSNLVSPGFLSLDFETGIFSNTPALKEISFNGNSSHPYLNFNKSALFTNGGTIFDTTSTKRKNLKVLVPKGNEITGISNEEWAKYGVDPIGAGVTLNTSAGSFSNGQMTKTYMYNVVNPSSSDLPVEASFEQPINLEEGNVFFGWNKTGSQNSFGLTFSTYSANIVESEWTWTKNSDNTVTLNSYIGKSTDIVVPNEIAGMPTQINLASGIDARGLGDEDWTKATSITFSNANGKKVKLLGNRIKFNSWTSLKSFDGRGLDTTGVETLNSLFGDNINLEEIYVDGWDTSQVIDFQYVFNHNYKLNTISGLNTWNVSKGENFYGTFNECHNLQSLDLSNWVTSSATKMELMFNKMLKLKNLDIQRFVTSGVTSFKWMFSANSVKNLDLRNFDISSATSMYGMFEQAVNLSQLDISHFKTDKVGIDMEKMFSGTPKLRVIDMRGFTNIDQQYTKNILGNSTQNSEISSVGEPEAAIGQPLMVISPEESSFARWDFVKESGRVPLELPKVVSSNKNYTFDNNQISKSYLSTITVVPSTLEMSTFVNWLNDQTKNKIIDKTFYYVKDVTPSKDTTSAQSVLDLLDTTYTVNVLESDWEFQLDSLDNTYKLVQYLGDNPDIIVPNEIDGKPTKIDLSKGISTPNLPGVKEYSVSGAESITFDNSDGKKVKLEGSHINFNNFRDLRTFDGSGLDTTGVQSLKDLFNNNQQLKSVKISSWDTSQVISMENSFNNCILLSQLDIESWNVSNVTSMKNMFRDTRELQFFDLRSWNLRSDIDMTSAFKAPYQPIPLLVIAMDENLLNHDYKKDNRSFSGPFFDANSGQFEDGELRKAYFTKNAIRPDDTLLKLETLHQFATSNIPFSDKHLFLFWGKNLDNVTDILQSLNTVIYAQWQYIPYIDDNKVTGAFEYGVAYIPRQFSFSKTELKDSGSQNIPFVKNNEFHIGVADKRNKNTQWTLTGQLIWDKGKEITGSFIKTTTSGQVKKNINNGTDIFKPSDLVSDGGVMQGISNIVIETEAPTMIMKTNNSGIKNGVFDVNLGDVSLEIENTQTIQPGTYTGHVEWNLVDGLQ